MDNNSRPITFIKKRLTSLIVFFLVFIFLALMLFTVLRCHDPVITPQVEKAQVEKAQVEKALLPDNNSLGFDTIPPHEINNGAGSGQSEAVSSVSDDSDNKESGGATTTITGTAIDTAKANTADSVQSAEVKAEVAEVKVAELTSNEKTQPIASVRDMGNKPVKPVELQPAVKSATMSLVSQEDREKAEGVSKSKGGRGVETVSESSGKPEKDSKPQKKRSKPSLKTVIKKTVLPKAVLADTVSKNSAAVPVGAADSALKTDEVFVKDMPPGSQESAEAAISKTEEFDDSAHGGDEEEAEDAAFGDDWVETAFDFYVGGNYYGWVTVRYNDNWIELKEPQEAIYLLPVIKNRQMTKPLFTGRLSGTREVPEIGIISVDLENFTLKVVIAQELVMSVPVEIETGPQLEGGFSFITSISARGSEQYGENSDEGRASIGNSTRVAYKQHRLATSGIYDSVEAKYELGSLEAQTDFTLYDTPLTLAGGLLSTPGQPFASSIKVMGLSLSSNREAMPDNKLLNANVLEVFVPTRALVEVFRDNAQTGEILFSRMLEFGNNQIDTSRFPRGSYLVEIVVSVDGLEKSREVQQFYKYGDIMPRETFDLNLTFGQVRDKTELLDVFSAFGSLRFRITDYLEGNASLYIIDDTSVLNLGTKGIYQSSNFGEVRYQFNYSHDLAGSALGYNAGLHWKMGNVNSALNYSRTLNNQAIYDGDMVVLSFPASETIDFRLSRDFKLFGSKPIQFSFSGRQRNSEVSGNIYRYGPQLQYSPFSTRRFSSRIVAQYDKTESDTEARLLFNLSYKFDPFSASSVLSSTRNSAATNSVWQNTVTFTGDENSHERLQKVTAKAIYSVNHSDLTTTGESTNRVTNLDAGYEGSMLDGRIFFNRTSATGGGSYGGDVVSTLVLGPEDMFHVTRSVSLGSALVAITVAGDKRADSLLAIEVDGSIKGYMRVGETVFIEAPTYKESKIEVREESSKKSLITILDPVTTVSPYPGNILRRHFDAVKVIIIAGRLVGSDGEPVAGMFFETGNEASYTDENGEFIVEMPVKFEGSLFRFIANSEVCEFSVKAETDEILVEAGEIKCREAEALELEKLRSQHENRLVD